MYVCMLGLTVTGRQFIVKGRWGIRVGNGLLRFGLGSGVRATVGLMLELGYWCQS